MKKIVKLTESDLVRLINKVIREESTTNMGANNKGLIQIPGCKKPSSKEEVMRKMSGEGSDGPFHCISVSPEVLKKLLPYKEILFKYNKASNQIELYESESGNFFTHFFGDWYGRKFLSIKMGPGFANKLPKEYSEEDSGWYYEAKVEGGKICLYQYGLC